MLENFACFHIKRFKTQNVVDIHRVIHDVFHRFFHMIVHS